MLLGVRISRAHRTLLAAGSAAGSTSGGGEGVCWEARGRLGVGACVRAAHGSDIRLSADGLGVAARVNGLVVTGASAAFAGA